MSRDISKEREQLANEFESLAKRWCSIMRPSNLDVKSEVTFMVFDYAMQSKYLDVNELIEVLQRGLARQEDHFRGFNPPHDPSSN
jgi:hypothetical protein